MRSLLWLLLASAAFSAEQSSDGNWPSFRGPHASGVAEGGSPPLHWDVKGGRNILWKTKIPGLGHSSPVIWGERIYLTTAVNASDAAELKVGLYGDIEPADDNGPQQWKVICLDRASGAILWNVTAHTGPPRVKRHTKASHANSTPATDGKRVIAFFGTEGLYAYDVKGALLWKKDFGVLDSGYYMVPSAQWGFGSSPILHDGKVIVQCDVQKGGFLAAFNADDGRELWRVPRNEVPTWSTPTVHVDVAGRAQVIVNGYRHSGGYDLATGKELWKLQGGGDIPVPTPIVDGGLIFLTSAHGPASPVYAIRTNVVGDISLDPGETSNEFIVWSVPRRGNYMQTPLAFGGRLYCCNDGGVLTCYNALTGDIHYRERLSASGDGFTASGVAGEDRLYFASERGKVFVLKQGDAFNVIATNDLYETCMASPAISKNAIYFRTRHHLVAVGARSER
ncbi:MAG: PQQ-binding-like beta-propeller repeat protein [Verrucomicrobiales bacterium]